MWDSIINGLLAQGPLGVAVVGLSYVVWQLYKELRTKEAEKAAAAKEALKEFQAVQEARVQDANKTVDRLVDVAKSLDRNSEVMKDALDALKDKR